MSHILVVRSAHLLPEVQAQCMEHYLQAFDLLPLGLLDPFDHFLPLLDNLLEILDLVLEITHVFAKSEVSITCTDLLCFNQS